MTVEKVFWDIFRSAKSTWTSKEGASSRKLSSFYDKTVF